ncbi:phage baseplate protein [Clostridium haemolyticum]|uniref:Dit-like phage tail protein N-terminal domain-containing protein n=1 Tax=Clostridium haemolyticum NCTC 9693 TaxID=1443114 RepID=A0ABR4TGX3_CLOHA|nr:hypothetical protein [Clostridium haemolyticum]KEI18248.1 hypothetical protein Z960_03760 [Clostridium haemolyticum NCTC 9693]KGN04170.1 hypothetical protein Z961_04255 [Clostridium haemolyticum NCTC 8350]
MDSWCKLGDIYFNLVEEEQVNFENEVTDKPVEDGSTITDHIQNKPIILNIKGAIFHRKVLPDWHINELRKIWKDKQVVTYIGMEHWGNVVVTSFRNTYTNTLRNGIEFEMTLQQIQVTKKSYVNINTGGFTIPDIEKLKEQIQDAKQDKKDAKREAKQAIKQAEKDKKKAAEKAAKAKEQEKKKAQTKVKKKTKKGRQAKKAVKNSSKGKKSVLQKIRNRF